MKNFLDGKVYDTETAKNVAEWNSNNHNIILYKKKTGEFFLLIDLESIEPISYDEAQEMAEKNLDTEKYNTIFGESKENANEGKKKLTLYIKSSIVDKAKMEAAKQGISVSEYITNLIEK